MSLAPLFKAERYELLTERQMCIVRCCMYFDVFNYPLTVTEIKENSAGENLSVAEIEGELQALKQLAHLEEKDGYYFLKGRSASVGYRSQLNSTARKFWPGALRMAKLISSFPFVEGVLITGSLSKNCMAADGDVDYLVITRPGRLWLCRGLLTAFKKIFLLNSRRYFCVNYYISSENLSVPDENIFTATEIAWAVPVYNAGTCRRFFEANPWVNDFYPNRKPPTDASIQHTNRTAIKGIAEKFLGGSIGAPLEQFFFRLFTQRWKRKFGGDGGKEFEINFRSRPDVSKHHPRGFQHKVLTEYEKRLATLDAEYELPVDSGEYKANNNKLRVE